MKHSKLSFGEHLKSVLAKVNKKIDLIHKFQFRLPRNYSSTICKSLARPHLGYDEVIHDKANNESFHKRLHLFSVMQRLQKIMRIGVHHLTNSTKK